MIIMKNKRMKIYIVSIAVVIVVAAIILLVAQQNGAFLCTLGSGIYAGQAVDNEQAVAKLSAFAGGVNRTNSPPFSSLVFNETRSKKTSIIVWQDGKQTEIKGFLLDVPYRNGDKLNYGDAYMLSDQGYLHKLSSANC